ncbi:DUF6571 family protein [Streptomyces sp. TS71-3]|uniref:DUF6571 family protein n=1 Tax=Streptomyces sp. TS71-3 TaxID=2733862 RepID=UPI001B026526|nr:DUF6571 family protein [Streptomyces sp. TS71-3]GHJ36130.1 hypothetical protein Sm713_17390 [Streptomyces sp. TS71-3]
MDLYDLRDATFATLGDAVDDWDQMGTKLSELEKDAKQGMKGQADRADWKGVNASVSKEFIGKTAKEFTDAHTEATTVHNVLRDAYHELVSYQKQLHTALDDADRQNLYVSCSGSQIIVTGKQSGPSGPAGGSYHEEDLQAMLRLLQGILNKANESDSSAAKVLDELMKQKPYGFSSASYDHLKEAADAIKDAERYANLMKKKGDDMSPAEFDELNKILTKYQNDPLFQEKFAESLGPRGLMDFWADISDPSDHGRLQQTRHGQFGELQKNLGMVLAGATQSDSPAMQKWEEDMVNSGPRTYDTKRGTMYGFQLMSNLMREGNWNDQFLDKYGNALVTMEKKPDALTHIPGRPDMVWNATLGGRMPYTMNFIGEDNGRDPMAGLMQAMSRSPDEAANFFNEKQPHDNAEWVLRDRPVFDTTPDNPHDGNQTLEATGRAMMAATTGMNPNEPNAHAVPHTPANRQALEHSMSVLARAGDGMHPELRDDLAKVFVNHGTEFFHTASALSDTDGSDLLNRDDLRELTKQVSRDGGAYHLLNDGIGRIVAGDISTSHYPKPDEALQRAGATLGFLEQSRDLAIGTDKPDPSWVAQYGAPLGVSVVSDLLPQGGNTVSTLGGDVIDAWQKDEQAKIDGREASQVHDTFKGREHEMDKLWEVWDKRFPGRLDHHMALNEMNGAANDSNWDVNKGWGKSG